MTMRGMLILAFDVVKCAFQRNYFLPFPCLWQRVEKVRWLSKQTSGYFHCRSIKTSLFAYNIWEQKLIVERNERS